MNYHSGTAAQHPHAAAIPSSASQGVRAYREPEVPHPLQLAFLEEDGERAWVAEMRDLLSAGKAAEADARLTEALAGFDGGLARLCKATRPETVELEGFDDLLPILEEWEGPAITAITLGLTNPADLAFEGGRTHEPELLLDLFSDEGFPFTHTGNADLLAECDKEIPDWAGAEEDVEFHCTVPGLAELNTALIHCKHRRFLRDGRDGVQGRAPGGYVEYVLGCWLLATRFLQAAQRAVKVHGVPRDCRVITGTVDVNADFVTVLGTGPRKQAKAKTEAASQPAFATLTVKPYVPREDPTAVAPAATLRQKLRTEEVQVPPARTGFLARLFGRLKRS